MLKNAGLFNDCITTEYLSHLFMSTVVRVKLTPLSQRIMKSRWQNGQLPTPSPSSLACVGKKGLIFKKKWLHLKIYNHKAIVNIFTNVFYNT